MFLDTGVEAHERTLGMRQKMTGQSLRRNKLQPLRPEGLMHPVSKLVFKPALLLLP